MNCFFCLLLLTLIVLKEGRTKSLQDPDNLTTCRVFPSSAVEGDQVVIICEFNHDVSSENFNVRLYKAAVDERGQGESTDLQILIYTKWQTDSTPRYEYYEEGYRIIGNVRTHMMVVIDSVTVEMAGNYSCHFISVEKNEVRHCNLEVTAKKHITSCDVLPVPMGENTSVVCHFNIDLLRGHRTFGLEKQSRHGVFLGRPVECIRQKENFKTCSTPDNDCVGLTDLQKSISCNYDPKQYYVDRSAVTPSAVTVVVLNVSLQSEAYYVCKAVPPVHPDLMRCQLSVSDRPRSTTVECDAQTTNIAAEDGDKHDDTSATHILAVVSFVGVVLIVTTVLVCLLYKYKWRVHMCNGRREDSNQGSNEQMESRIPLPPTSAGITETGGDTLPSPVAVKATGETSPHPFQAAASLDPQTSVSQPGQNTDTTKPHQVHCHETGAVETSTASPGSPELEPLVQGAEDGSVDKDEKQ